MAKGSIVSEYNATTRFDKSPTFIHSAKIQQEINKNGIDRPHGYTVSYHANPAIERHHFGEKHPMKPWRILLTKAIVMSYGMHTAMDNYLSRPATLQELKAFHKEDYVDFLSSVTPTNIFINYPELSNGTGFTSSVFGVGDDCPIFDGLFDYCALYAGASLDAARKLCNNQSDIAINWSGGLHHAKKGEASGFCYVNDIVLAILQLLRHHPRVLYIDIDVHHGDGVEQAFWSTDRVFCVSFHKYDKENFFPGTGPLESQGPTHPDNPGNRYTINVPLNDGVDDITYEYLFQNIISSVIDHYDPTAIVLQCGADSLGYDRLGCFNLNIKGHGQCLSFVKRYVARGIPLLVVGGGGYTPRNVARAWAYETSICINADQTISEELPLHMPHREAFRKEGMTLYPNLGTGKFANLNTKQDVERVLRSVHEQLQYVKGAPRVQLRQIPPDITGWREEMEEEWLEVRREKEEGLEEKLAGMRWHGGGRRKELERRDAGFKGEAGAV